MRNVESITLQNCLSIEEVVELINEDRLADFTKEDLAAQYAFQGTLEAIHGLLEARDGLVEENFKNQLDALIEEGGEFDYAEALKKAVEMSIGYDDKE